MSAEGRPSASTIASGRIMPRAAASSRRNSATDLQLAGRRALITGGSKGIGRATAEVLAEEGMDLLLVARSADALEATAYAIRSTRQVQVETLAADLSQEAEVLRLARHTGEIDVLVNNAGAIPPGTLLAVDNDTWRRAWDLKVFGFISLCRQI
jgi:short-subunit dehydrogenase